MSDLRWYQKMVFFFSAERRALTRETLNNIKVNLSSNGYARERIVLRSVHANPTLLRHVAAHSTKQYPELVLTVLAALGDSVDKDLIELTDQHFTIYHKVRAIYDTLDWQDETFAHDPTDTLRYALNHVDEWPLLSILMRERGLWEYEDLMAALSTMKESGHTAFAGGAL